MSKTDYAAIIKKARESEPEALPGDETVDIVNLSIRVPRKLRRHWVAEARRRDTTVTALVTELLSAVLGTP